MIMGQGYSQAGAFLGVLNISLHISFWNSFIAFLERQNKGIQLTCFDPKTLRYEQGDPTDLLDV